MLLGFFEHLRKHRVPVSFREILDLLTALKQGLVRFDQLEFYFLSRLCLIKDEKYYDRFDQAFSSYFSDTIADGLFELPLPAELLWQSLLPLIDQTGASQQEIEDWYQEYLSLLREQRLADERSQTDARDLQQDGEMESGSKGVGNEAKDIDKNGVDDPFDPTGTDTSEHSDESGDGQQGEEGDSGEGEAGHGEGGDSGEGEGGDSGEGEDGDSGEGEEGQKGEGNDGIKGLGLSEQGESGERAEASEYHLQRADKVWEQRLYQDLDEDVELGTRNLKMALRRLRKFVRESAEDEFDLHGTITATARQGGLLDIKMVPERHNAVKVLMLLDIGGSMDAHVELCAQLFAAARSEFKHLEFYHFHNFVYESVWDNNLMRQEDRLSVPELIRTYGRDYKLILVGDAHMARHEITERGGSVEHYNTEPGEVWLRRLQDHFGQWVWLNPTPEREWQNSHTITLTRRLMDDHMYHLSVEGLTKAIRYLAR